MLFSKKDVIPVAHTLEECASCGGSSRRKFRKGDVLFGDASPCGCGGRFKIAMIYGEIPDR